MLSCRPTLLFLVLIGGLTACAGEVQLLSAETAPFTAPAARLPMTVAVSVRAFEAEEILERGVTVRFATTLRNAALFQAVMHPIPSGARPRFAIQLLVRDAVSEPDSNFWKAAVAYALLPAALFVWLQTEYTLSIEALFFDRNQIVASYTAESRVRYQWQINADRPTLWAAGFDRVIEHTSRQVLSQLSADAPMLRRLTTGRSIQ